MPAGPSSVRLVRRADAFERDATDEVLLLAPDADEPMALRGAAVTAWRLLATSASMHDLAERAVAGLTAGEDPAVAVGEVADAVRSLRDAGLVVVAE